MNDTALPNNLRLDTVRAAYQAGHLSPRQLILALREKAAALNPDYHLFIHLLSVVELEPYLVALEGRELKDLPLYGVPFAIKDNIDLAGIPTTAACPDYAYTPERSATVVEQLIALGAVPMGGLNGSRSPYGACPNSVLADYPSGGSSSGSSLAVGAGGQQFLAGHRHRRLGASTGGAEQPGWHESQQRAYFHSGRRTGLSYPGLRVDLHRHGERSQPVTGLIARFDPRDEYSRRNPQWNDASAFGAPRPFRFGVPRAEDLEFFGCAQGPSLFGDAINRLTALGGEAVSVDLSPFLEAARLLYEGPWVAERYSVAGQLMEDNPEAVLPVIRAVLGKAPSVSGVDTFEGLDCVVTPSIGRPVTSAELTAEPVLRNSELGYYTNFVNLLDYAAIAVPGAFMDDGLPWGVTLFGRAFTDQYLLSLADAFQRQTALPLIGGDRPSLPAPTTAQTTWRPTAGGHAKLRRLSPVRTGRWPAVPARHGARGQGWRRNCRRNLGAAKCRAGLVSGRHPGAARAGQSATGRRALGNRFHLRSLWSGGRAGHQSSRWLAGTPATTVNRQGSMLRRAALRDAGSRYIVMAFKRTLSGIVGLFSF